MAEMVMEMGTGNGDRQEMGTMEMGTDLFSLWTEPVQRENRSVPISIVPISITISMNSLIRG